jgi:hypothetical protein
LSFANNTWLSKINININKNNVTWAFKESLILFLHFARG